MSRFLVVAKALTKSRAARKTKNIKKGRKNELKRLNELKRPEYSMELKDYHRTNSPGYSFCQRIIAKVRNK
ncbi:hypothetical protein ANAPRD1_01355 [Anaplasma phagocytophilum]|nr:hypothetical protein ANAPRD1_01355 [Anaplasma phagocytophilum]